MKQYIYKPGDIGLKSWPQGELRLNGIEITEDAKAADVFVVPGALTSLFPMASALRKLPHFHGNEAKHVLFDCSDNEPLYDLPCRFIRCNTRTWYLQRDINTISWPWPVEDFGDCMKPPREGFRYDVSFQGWIWSDARKQSVQSLTDSPLKLDFSCYSDFFGYIEKTPEGIRRRARYKHSLRESRLALCPESIPGVFPYRFFEAMSAGRVPVLIGSGYVLPWAQQIPYANFCLFIERDQASTANEPIKAFLRDTSDAELIAKGLEARHYFDKYLNRDKWPDLMGAAVMESL